MLGKSIGVEVFMRFNPLIVLLLLIFGYSPTLVYLKDLKEVRNLLMNQWLPSENL